MKRFTVSVALFYVFLSTTGCLTELDVKKVSTQEPNPNGFYYSLAIPFLVVKPNGDGTMEVEVEYLPDPEHQYAVSGWSFLGAHDLTVEVDDQGILKKIVWNADDSAVAAGLAESAGNIGAAKITADGEDKKAQETQMEEQAKALADKLGEAKKAEAETQTEYEVALANLKTIEELHKESKATYDEVKKARLEVVAAEVRRDAARRTAENVAASLTFSEPASTSAKKEKEKELQVLEENLQNLRKTLEDLNKTTLTPGETQEDLDRKRSVIESQLQKAQEDLGKAQTDLQTIIDQLTKKFPSAWGWVWYKIDEDSKDGETDPLLQAIKSPLSAPSGQLLAPSSGPPKKGSKPSELTLQITSPSQGVIELETGALAKITIETNQDLASAPDKTKGDAKLICKIDGLDVTTRYLQRTTLDLINKRKLTVDIAPSAPTGIYKLEMNLAIDSSENPQNVPKDIEIELLRK